MVVPSVVNIFNPSSDAKSVPTPKSWFLTWYLLSDVGTDLAQANCNLHTGAKSEPNRHQISNVGTDLAQVTAILTLVPNRSQIGAKSMPNFQCWHRFGTGNSNLKTGAKSEPNRHQISDVGIEHFLAPVNSSGVGIDLVPHSLWAQGIFLKPTGQPDIHYLFTISKIS